MQEQSTRGHQKIGRANIAYHDLVADLYDGSEGEAFQYTEFFQTRLENIVAALADKSGAKTFLDIGCGTGKVLKYAERVFDNAIGIDVSFNMLEIANKRGYEVIQADALSLPFRDETFDVVSIYSVLHHIYDYTSIFHEVGRVMKRKGLLYTDWDPNRMQDSNINGWPLIRRLTKVRTALTRKLLDAGHKSMINEAVYTEVELQKRIDKELMEEAEYHNIGEGRIRGIDFKLIKKTLLAEGFVNITPKYHWHGYTLDQIISGSRITSTRILLRIIKILGIKIERHMENIQITASKS